MAQVALLQRGDDRTHALRDSVAELLRMDEPRRHLAATMSGLDIHYDLGDGHPLLGRRMPDLDLVTAGGPRRVFELLHGARPVLLNLGGPGALDVTPWADRVALVDADVRRRVGAAGHRGGAPPRPPCWSGPTGTWRGSGTRGQTMGLDEALTIWFGSPTWRPRAPVRPRASGYEKTAGRPHDL